jgi:DNA polymerase-3 subunit beta
MKLQTQRNELLGALQAVIGVVERRQTMPILSNLLLKAENDVLTVTATDLELELVTRIAVAVGEPGAITVPARKLLDICRGLPESAEIRLEVREQRLRVTSGRSRFVLSTLPATEFPFLDEIEGGDSVSLPQGTFKRLLERTQFAMAHQDVRYYLNGLLLVIGAQGIRAVATDGHRLALSDAEFETGIADTRQVIVPRKAVVELLRMLAASDEPVRLTLSDNHIQVHLPDIRFTSKLIDGRFPDYQRVIPEEGDKRVTGDREAVRQALSRTAILSNEKFKGVRLSLDENRLSLQAQNPDQEEAEDEIEVQYGDAPIEIGFNVNYLVDALSVMEGDEFTLELTGPDSSGLLREKGDDSSQYVVMPMRL